MRKVPNMFQKLKSINKAHRMGSDVDELPPIKKKEAKKLSTYGKTTLFSKKKKNKFVSPYMKKKMPKLHHLGEEGLFKKF